MEYREPVFRPPSEAYSFLLQITYGCSHNKCTFCGMYPTKKYEERPLEDIFTDIDEARLIIGDVRRIFLCDGNSLNRSTEDLVNILQKLEDSFPQLQRVGIYANASDILKKSDEELKLLKDHKLGITYLGLESGCKNVLLNVRKGATAEEMALAVQKAQSAGIKVSVIFLLGLGGKTLSHDHAIESAKTVNKMQPVYLSALTLMLLPGTPLYKQWEKGEFVLPDQKELLEELYLFINNLDLKSTIFRSNHASNYLALGGRFPKDKEKILATIRYALDGGNEILRPEFLRGL
ncbi:MAG: hypothetical protein A2161_19880 [Candidatus Schekmanbacteria bacterium RBG_13_48_7]|uniref:Radical SAM core domain-containing protein n=1 Tax=Candidatus Schekmanbacteria bacterium RBG_13_48_7 TaxID=1817878 RepID=A0A1F7S1I2_9BACT|nr:MAG: hypothetical protein A2161_19880 [Candidatus Schekmanbacteria bacterium RBG_13_48_7]